MSKSSSSKIKSWSNKDCLSKVNRCCNRSKRSNFKLKKICYRNLKLNSNKNNDRQTSHSLVVVSNLLKLPNLKKLCRLQVNHPKEAKLFLKNQSTKYHQFKKWLHPIKAKSLLCNKNKIRPWSSKLIVGLKLVALPMISHWRCFLQSLTRIWLQLRLSGS